MSIRLLWHDRLLFAHDCEGCGEKIKKAETHYVVSMGTSGDVLLPLGQIYYYHESCFDPYMIVVWLQEGQAVSISQHEDG
jgi:hypothetical protein